MPSCPGICPVTARAVQGMARTLARLAAWPLVSGQSASGGSMSRVAEGHFRRKREVPLILRGSTSQFRGHPGPGPGPTAAAPSRPRSRPPLRPSVLRFQFGYLRVRSFMHPELRREMSPSDHSGSVQPRPCAADRDWSAGPVWPSRLMPGAEVPFRSGRLAAAAKAACWSPSQGPSKEASTARRATRLSRCPPRVRRSKLQRGHPRPLPAPR